MEKVTFWPLGIGEIGEAAASADKAAKERTERCMLNSVFKSEKEGRRVAEML